MRFMCGLTFQPTLFEHVHTVNYMRILLDDMPANGNCMQLPDVAYLVVTT